MPQGSPSFPRKVQRGWDRQPGHPSAGRRSRGPGAPGHKESAPAGYGLTPENLGPSQVRKLLLALPAPAAARSPPNPIAGTHCFTRRGTAGPSPSRRARGRPSRREPVIDGPGRPGPPPRLAREAWLYVLEAAQRAAAV
jgi:hypothetical protein